MTACRDRRSTGAPLWGLIVVIAWSWCSVAPCKSDDDLFVRAADVLQRRCLRCHNPIDFKGEMSLERQQDVLGAGIIDPGKPDASRLLQVVVASQGDAPEMPLNESPLTAADVESLRAWVAAGAPWPEGAKLAEPVVSDTQWWSLLPLNAAPPPTLNELIALAQQHLTTLDPHWLATPIDAFIVQRLLREGLTPAPEADRRTLIRRLYFDLLGLPPTPQQVRDFENDIRPLAYERLVERLLASPRYGERWARHWLDVVHYGDTHGFDKDKVRKHAWPYRDYVIASFNDDKPYEQFVLEQLAGDALFPNSPQGVVATGFIAAGPFDWVGQIEVSEGQEKSRVRNLDRDDMVATTMNTFVSLTAQCARCHNHKFDPIKQRDYYGLQAVFAAVDRADRAFDPDAATSQARQALRERIGAVQRQQSALKQAILDRAGPELGKIEARLAELAEQHQRRAEFGYHSRIESRPDRVKWVQVDLGASPVIDRVVLVACHDTFNNIGAGFGFPVRWKIEVANDAQFEHGVLLVADQTRQDFANPGVIPQVFPLAAPTEARYVRLTATHLAPRQNDYILALAELMVYSDQGLNVAAGRPVEALDSIDAPPRWALQNLVDGYFFGGGNDAEVREAVELAVQGARVREHSVPKALQQQRRDLEEQRVKLRDELNSLPEPSMVFAAATQFEGQGAFQSTQGKPRPIYLLHRGNESQPDVRGGALAPSAISALEALNGHFDLPPNHAEYQRREALARWIVDPQNPLTWRSVVNRVWQHHFGQGLVATPNDFGRMGAEPSHAELLDWLARTFRDSGQSWKQLHFTICTSSTYKQQSTHRPQPAQLDGGNRWLWRANRRRLEAESIRDSALAVAGVLQLNMGGPGFQSFGFEDDHSPHYRYEEYDPSDASTHRRSIYGMIVRSVPDPLMTALDCADPSLSVPERTETLTALQALALMNHRLITQLAHDFADRVADAEADPRRQVELAFELALSRPPTQEETAALWRLRQQEGLAYCCRTLFNLNEFVFVD